MEATRPKKGDGDVTWDANRERVRLGGVSIPRDLLEEVRELMPILGARAGLPGGRALPTSWFVEEAIREKLQAEKLKLGKEGERIGKPAPSEEEPSPVKVEKVERGF